MTDPRINLSDAAKLTAKHAELVVVPLDTTTLGLTLVIDTEEFARLSVSMSIGQVRCLAMEFTRAAECNPEQMAALMEMLKKGNQDD
ncbi:hypothetical protein [Mycobacterium sp. P7213]|uniref:hypothetical protein n=1 Tax=Mycobacterium sp. P7213 TaxID=2478465 RepID=UPI000F62B529|nr:hypothetical protein [Mycobacterium sp. P7213]